MSSQDPKRSSYYDVDHTKLETFFLSNGSNQFGVDLKRGEFWVNGVTFSLHDTDTDGTGAYRLIFNRRHVHQFNVRQEEIDHKVSYRLGWERDDGNGGTVSRVMEVI